MNRKIILHCMTTMIIFLIIPCLISGCSAKIDEETQEKIDQDATHAEKDALQYLSKKYDMEFELQSFEPYTYVLTSDTDWHAHYDGEWNGEFIVNGETYNIRGYIPVNIYMDDYQREEIHTAYTELMQQYFTDLCEVDGVTCKVAEWSGRGVISVYYDGTNIGDCLKKDRISIVIDITNAGFSEELLRLCENSVAEFEKEFEKKYEGINYRINIMEGEESLDYVWRNSDKWGVYYHRFDYDKWVNSEHYGTEGITVSSLNEYDKSEKFHIFKEYKYK